MLNAFLLSETDAFKSTGNWVPVFVYMECQKPEFCEGLVWESSLSRFKESMGNTTQWATCQTIGARIFPVLVFKIIRFSWLLLLLWWRYYINLVLHCLNKHPHIEEPAVAVNCWFKFTIECAIVGHLALWSSDSKYNLCFGCSKPAR